VSVRAVREEDYAALAALLAEDEERLLGRPSRVGVEDVRSWLHATDLDSCSWLYEDGGVTTAVGWVVPYGEVGIAVGVVREEEKGRGLGSELVRRAEDALRGAGAARVHEITLAADSRAPALFAAQGYREVRRFWEMTVELDRPPPEPTVPSGMRLEAFDERDARAFHDVLEDAFRDHWEHHARPFEEWWDEKRAVPDYDPTLWFVVRDGDGLAAVVRNDPSRAGGGWVGALGVRRAKRGLGLGRALLLRTFAEFRARGVTRVGLGVDAENSTGATRLYESVGMHVEVEQVVYEKELR
jgi:mycothiol synthase